MNLLALFLLPQVVVAFASTCSSSSSCTALSGSAGELGLPCEAECAISKYPNMPESVHPGVLSGQAVIDLLEDAKKKGKMRFYMDRFEGCLSSITADAIGSGEYGLESLLVLHQCLLCTDKMTLCPRSPPWCQVFRRRQ
jgi:hypothetical protein